MERLKFVLTDGARMSSTGRESPPPLCLQPTPRLLYRVPTFQQTHGLGWAFFGTKSAPIPTIAAADKRSDAAIPELRRFGLVTERF